MTFDRTLLRRVLAGLAGLVVASASAQTGQPYPSRPVRIIVGFSAGSATDILARLIAERFSKTLGQSVIVDNKPGAGGSVGAELAKNAAPDGYTLVAAGSGPFAINPALSAKLPYDPVRDFEPIGNVVLTPQTLVTGAQAPYRSLKDLMAAAKARPGEVPYASLGAGSTSHLTIEALQAAAGVKLNHVPFKGSPDAQMQLIGGTIPLLSDTVSGVLAQVRAGKLRALAVAILQRSPFLPDVPTVSEEGYPGFESVGWIGLAAPARTPLPIVERLNAEIRVMLGDASVKARLDQLAFTPAPGGREAFAAFVKAEIAKWSKVARDSGARMD